MRTALMVIDLQVGMFNGVQIAPIPAGEALLTRVGAVIARARLAGVPVIYVRHGGPPGAASMIPANGQKFFWFFFFKKRTACLPATCLCFLRL
jgi:nicotinamidase-related amidase